MLDLTQIRSRFPALAGDDVLFDNAGGSVTLRSVADRIRDYLFETDVQLGASYPRSQQAAARYRAAREGFAAYVGAAQPEDLIFGPSSTVLLRFLAEAMSPLIEPGDEIVVCRADHEANVGPWLALAERRGATVRWWEPDPALGATIEGLEAVLSDRCKLVAVGHVSNILGAIHPIAEAAERAHAVGARIAVDGVAFAPHRAIDLAGWGVDYYVFSLYKTYGPHHAVMTGTHEALLALDPVNHYFFSREQLPGKLEPGNANYELSYGSLGVLDYLAELQGMVGAEPDPQARAAWDAIAAHEEQLARRLLDYLATRADVRVIGPARADRALRVPTISFVVEGRRAEDVVLAIDPHGVGVRHGHFYAARLIDHLGLAEQGGVVRASLVHYNTLDEVDRLIAALELVLS